MRKPPIFGEFVVVPEGVGVVLFPVLGDAGGIGETRSRRERWGEREGGQGREMS